jgi:hypothetical protein
MDPLQLAIRILHAELAHLDRMIATLESFDARSAPAWPRKRQGRKFMGEKERRQVSARMKKLWAARHQAEAEENAEKSEQEVVDEMREARKSISKLRRNSRARGWSLATCSTTRMARWPSRRRLKRNGRRHKNTEKQSTRTGGK